MNLKCLIIDDEPHALRILEKYIRQVPYLECEATTTKSIEALQLIEKFSPDLIFLDIQMPDLTGIQLSKLISGDVKVIFTTAYAQFAVEGFELNATDYLLKPISFSRFLEAVEKVKKLKAENRHNSNENEASENFFFVKTDGKNKFQKVDFSEILYLESIRNYVVIHTKHEQIVTYNTLKHFEENLPSEKFIKTHKSYIVSIAKVSKTDTSEVWVGDDSLPLGDTYRHTFFEKIRERRI
ncbi:DNA-binding response regulator [Christiangramia fulva]|uniref:DNA-binding response regulator n=1 Tax=Christiangramia fulva TaxID=2126553 RepID=A0A2R3Z366_9FLAO|nr:LytTR family DNA-binding domain-containing protein [Christiangramia fulva]AVR44689.1 DNA-binding response regulator [Christiangramia fulva]